MKYFYMIFIFSSLYSISQESINAKILDSTSKKPIPFATISINNNSGVISNDTGEFSMYLNKESFEKDSLTIRCLGYESKHYLLKTFRDSIILLNPKSIELNEILVSNKNYSVEEILEKSKENLAHNYDFDFTKSKLFFRSSYTTNILKNEVVIKKTTIPEFNQKFIDSLLNALPKNTDDYTEILANLYGKAGQNDFQKLDIIKASHLFDKRKEMSFEAYEDRISTILKKSIKRDSYFKIKSGILGTKQEIDESFFDSEKKEKPDETEAFIEQKKKQEQERKNNFLKYKKSTISKLQHDSFTFENSDLNFLEKPNRYNFKIEDYSFLNNDFVYKISFTPKRSEDYKGVLYINTDDFAIIRVDYENVKNLKSFNLFGISYNAYLKKGTLIYAKNASNKYALKYTDVEEGNKFGIKRPLSIIEKNKHTKGRRKQNELSSNIHFIVSNTEKKELVIFENEPITETVFTNFQEKPKVTPVSLSKYDPDFWKGETIIEPNQAIKDFKSLK
ncbi:carboxypeptidase-like regulatory domain-containing protein [Mariniflexile jejuense]|uniref:Carboxypeptidase-like regulatory domain-containing protein n=1 Tax=Mariniflexile jejuense TaxID=1173582 RepID=A0ABW3JJ33_9FLAO